MGLPILFKICTRFWTIVPPATLALRGYCGHLIALDYADPDRKIVDFPEPTGNTRSLLSADDRLREAISLGVCFWKVGAVKDVEGDFGGLSVTSIYSGAGSVNVGLVGRSSLSGGGSLNDSLAGNPSNSGVWDLWIWVSRGHCLRLQLEVCGGGGTKETTTAGGGGGVIGLDKGAGGGSGCCASTTTVGSGTVTVEVGWKLPLRLDVLSIRWTSLPRTRRSA